MHTFVDALEPVVQNLVAHIRSTFVEPLLKDFALDFGAQRQLNEAFVGRQEIGGCQPTQDVNCLIIDDWNIRLSIAPCDGDERV